ncbi:MAG: GNAT family N-acetyltransferase [Clostridia bacterium]|nr:GNAT family N-acetyltransferase [Clostridia bacterium]
MIIRRYKDEDCDIVSKLFYETVHSVNSKDYTAEQLTAWANNADSLKVRRNDLLKQYTLIAEIIGVIVGFGSIDKSGYLDLLFVHKDYQNQGIATALCNELEKGYLLIKTYASITAKPFFESRGYSVIKEQEIERFGVKLKNFEMQKKNAT